MRFLGVVFLCISLLSIANAAKTQRFAFNNPALAARFDVLTHSFRCLVCQNEDLADSGATLAVQLKDQIHQQLQNGWSDEQIQAYLVKRYGEFVLFKPPFRARTLLLWLGPWLVLALGAVVVFRMFKRNARRVGGEDE